MTKELQTVSVTFLLIPLLPFNKRQDAQRFSSWRPPHPESMAPILQEWNSKVFFRRESQIALCEAFTDPESSRFELYLFSSAKSLPPAEGNNYSPL